METTLKQLYSFVLSHITRENSNDVLALMFKLSDEINKLNNTIKIMETTQQYIMQENKHLKTELSSKIERRFDKVDECLDSLNTSIYRVDNSNVVNMLQLTKYQLEELKSFQVIIKKEDKATVVNEQSM